MNKKVSKKVAPKKAAKKVAKKAAKKKAPKKVAPKKVAPKKEMTKKEFEEIAKKELDPIFAKLVTVMKKYRSVHMGFIAHINTKDGHSLLVGDHVSDEYKERAIRSILMS